MAARILVHIVGLMVAVFGRAAVAPADVARQFIPTNLGNDAAKIEFSAVKTRFGASIGRQYIVAYYVIPEKTALLILEERSGAWITVHTISLSDSACVSNPNLDLQDLDRDGRPEVLAACTEYPGNRTATDIYRWTGALLKDVVVGADDQATTLGVVHYSDFDGDGRDEIISVTPALIEIGETDSRTIPVFSLYAEREGLYRLSRTLAYFQNVVYPKQVKTKSIQRDFFEPEPGSYVLRVAKPAVGSLAVLEITAEWRARGGW